MQIQLSVVSPKVELPGLSDGIEKLNQLKEILNELRGGKPVEVKIGVSGLDKMKTQAAAAAKEMSNMTQSLIKQLETLGGPNSLINTSKPVATIKAGFKDAATEMKYLANLKQQLGAEEQHSRPGSPQADSLSATMNTAQLRIEELQEAATGAASAEEKLTATSKLSAKALADQEKIAAAKAKTLKKLAAAAGEATEAEKKLGAEAKKTGGQRSEIGGQAGTVIGRKFIEVKDGEEGRQMVSETRQVGPGHQSVETDKAITENISEVEKLKYQLATLGAQYEQTKAAAAKMGQTEQQLAQITRNHAEAVIKAGVKLKETTAGQGAMLQGKRLLLAAEQQEARARQQTMRAAPGGGEARSFKETRKREMDDLVGGIRKSVAAHQEEIMLGKASMRTDLEKIAMLTQKAAAYRFLANEARAAKEPGLGMQLDRRAAGAESDAVKLGNRPQGIGGMIGKKFAELPKTMMTVTLWMTAYSAFFNGMKMIDSGIEAMIKYDAQTAQLQSVMRGTHEEAAALRDTVIGLAIATGRSGEEAMDAAIRWSRLGLSQKEVAQATEISLKSASISGLTAEESTEQLSGLVASWGLTIPQLNSAFEQMNAMAVRFNASDKELMSGLQRTGALAHQMGMDLSEAMSLVSLISGTTGRPGAEGGNALKRYMVNMGDPGVQEKLSQNFGVKILNDDGSMKSQRDLLGELSIKYNTLSTARQNDLVTTIAGTLQANRLAIVLKDLTKAQALEVESLMDFNRADIENQVRRDTMEKDVNALKTAWGQFWVYVGEDMGALNKLRAAVTLARNMLQALDGAKNGAPDENQNARNKWKAAIEEVPQQSLFFDKPDADHPIPAGFHTYQEDNESDADFDRRMKEKAKIAEDYMRSRMKEIETKIKAGKSGYSERTEYNRYKSHFEAEYDDSDDNNDQDLKNLERLKATAQAAHAVIHNLGEAMNAVRQNSLTPRAMENVAQGAFPFVGEGKAESAFTGKMRAMEKAGDAQGEINLFLERQNELKKKSSEADDGEAAARKKLVATYDEEYAANQKVIDAKLKDGADEKDVKDLRARQDVLEAARQQAATPGKFVEPDQEGMVPTDYPVVTHGRMRGIEQVFGALSGQRYEVDKNKREQEMIAQEQAALDAMEAGKGDKMLATEKAQLDKELREKRLEAAERAPFAEMQDRVALAQRTAQNIMAQAAVGRNEPQQQRGEVRAAEEAAQRAGVAAKYDIDRVSALGRVAEVETYINTLKEMQISNEARRATLAADITNEARKQNEEAAKALLMASREDQLKAALTKAAVNRMGHGFSAERFQFLSQETRQNIERYNPDALPPQYMNHLRELKRESGQAGALGGELPGAIARLEAMLAKMPQFQLPSDGGHARGADFVKPPTFNFSFGAEFKQLAEITGEAVRRPLQNEINNIRSMVYALAAGHQLGSAQSAAQGV